MRIFDLIKCFLYGLLLSFVVFLIQRDRGFGVFHCLSDACFVSGVFLAGCGGLLFAAAGGAFDLLFYSVHSLFTVTFRRKSGESFVEYVSARQKKRKGFLAELTAGAVFILLSVLFWFGSRGSV